MKRNPEAPGDKSLDNPVALDAGPIVSPQITDPAALRYAAQFQARTATGGLPKYSAPVAGGATPPIPRLDQPADTEHGLTMADQATMQRAANEAPGSIPSGMFMGAPTHAAATAPPPAMSRPPEGLLPIDILPNEAREDPAFREGHGSMYATAQPAMAYKYGVLRNGNRVLPQQLAQPNKGLSQKSIDDLKALESLRAAGPAQPPPVMQPSADEKRVEREAASGSAGAAGRLGNAPTDGPQSNARSSAEAQDALKKLDDFDFNSFRESLMKDIINNDEQRELVEKRCKPLDITDIIMRGFVTQKVPIIPNKFEPEFQSMTGGEDLAIKRLIIQESKGIEVSDRYILDKFSLMSVTLGLRSVNNNVLPSHQDARGDFDEEKFWLKFNHVIRYPFHMLSSLGVHFFWFDIRVRRLFVAEKLGNG